MPPDESSLEERFHAYTAQVDKAASYTNLVMAAGYAGFFGFWSLAERYVTRAEALLAIVPMIVSLLAFVLHEVWRAGVEGIANHGLLAAVLANDTDKENLVLSAYRKRALFLARSWPYSFFTSVVLGVLGYVVLLVSFVRGVAFSAEPYIPWP